MLIKSGILLWCGTMMAGGASAVTWPRMISQHTTGVRDTVAVTSDTLPLFLEHQVDRPVRVVSWKGLRYPDSLKVAKVEGDVVIRFVVDIDGGMEPESVKVLRSSHAHFTKAVMAILANGRFTPAVHQGKEVGQLVQQTFIFALPRDRLPKGSL